jgi:hypothetical protein
VISIFLFTESCCKKRRQTTKRERASDDDSMSPGVRVEIDGRTTLLELRWRLCNGGFETVRPLGGRRKHGIERQSLTCPSSDCNCIGHVILLCESLTHSQVHFPLKKRFDAVEIRLGGG